MSSDDLKSYQVQLDQVNLALEKDPSNSDLLTLQNDLKELINLIASASKEPAPVSNSNNNQKGKDKERPDISNSTNSTSSLNKTKKFKVGDNCLAKYSGDNQYYEAVVSGVTEIGETMYSVVFVGYENIELVKQADIKPVNVNRPVVPQPQTNNKRAATSTETEDAKKKKKATTTTPAPKKENETAQKQQAWLNFTKTAAKKKSMKAPAINQKSIFATPDNPNSKVGVIGSGKGMTGFRQRGKHLYN
ncbi:hypothetical protein CONCODRAFT_29440, partial [Conidiobolus coronatus NRRL 28638]